MARTQTLVQFTDDLLSLLDEQASRTGRSRSELIREAVASYLGQVREAELDRQLVAAYTRIPQEDLGDDDARQLIAEEPW